MPFQTVCVAKDTELLLEQLSKDQEAVDQVRFIVEQEEATMKRETQIVQDYADVSDDQPRCNLFCDRQTVADREIKRVGSCFKD